MTGPTASTSANANASTSTSANTGARTRRRAALWVLPIETGGCGACAQSIAALRSPGFAPALGAEGIAFATSPRHADVLLVAGPLSAAARDAVRRVVEAAPLPRALVAVGDCAIDGCVFAGSPQITASVAEDLDVNVEIAGCPPSPDAILAAIGEAARLLAGAGATPADQEPATAEGAGDGDDDGDGTANDGTADETSTDTDTDEEGRDA